MTARIKMALHLLSNVAKHGHAGIIEVHGVQYDWNTLDEWVAEARRDLAAMQAEEEVGLGGDKAGRPVRLDPIVEAVRADLLQRSQVGLAKYGTTLDRKDLGLRDWLQHAYEETLDQANYLKCAIQAIDAEAGATTGT